MNMSTCFVRYFNLFIFYFKMENSNCILCDRKLEYIKYNLNSTKAKSSGSSLMTLIENITGKIFGTNLDICETCFELLNELDAMLLRVAEINNILKGYIEMRFFSCHLAKEKLETNFTELEIKQFCEGSNVVLDEHFKDVENYETKIDHLSNDLSKKKEDVVAQQKENQELPQPEEILTKSSSETREFNIMNSHESCTKRFQTFNNLESLQTSHNPSYVCEICGRSYKHKRNFESHSKLHSGVSLFSCTYCQKSFTHKSDLIRHVPIHTGEKPHQCEKCGKRFIHHTSFNLHIKTHTGNKTHKCAMCNQGFTTTSHLKRHIRVHTGEKNFTCPRCGKRFAERYNLAAHEKLHNSKLKSKQKKFSCRICEESFERKQRLEEHRIKKHPSLMLNMKIN